MESGEPETVDGILELRRLEGGSGRYVGTIGLGATARSCTISQ